MFAISEIDISYALKQMLPACFLKIQHEMLVQRFQNYVVNCFSPFFIDDSGAGFHAD